ncbi:helix-turn-helix domain-containing protein [Myroides marinus]|uniref:helix-turn-helix domain-containing protein n=1 Tax=Myroides marinus TaxID=703342 RepID=UPI0025775718|nr:helix-turn-helix domain-containing protein [Myroides marinus]MDM1369430.1 helix-turn-helix domain-containing protein [Myroides marinus]MDM1372871.1 helix-turn-helix domain-containing protein [Myroides marinus]MDM1390818.1 helix-turn-helix domain-containing protein [Myroides marinus]
MEYSVVLHVKNMVCYRCVLVVEQELKKLGILEAKVQLGRIALLYTLSEQTLRSFELRLKQLGFELLIEKQEILIENIKQLIIDIVQKDSRLSTKLSYLISQSLAIDYSYASKIFSERESITIEKYYIYQRIERVKEYISYGEMTLLEIASKMYYNDLSHLSKQFKSVMGVSPSQYKKEQNYNRNYIDKIIT